MKLTLRMGSFFSHFCCSNCCKTETKQSTKSENKVKQIQSSNNENSKTNNLWDQISDKNDKKVKIKTDSDQISIVSSNISAKEEEKGQLLIDEQRLKQELEHSVKGGDDSYEKVMNRQKSLPLEEYNEFGLIDMNSEHFSIVKNLTHTLGYELIESIGSGNYAEVYKAFIRQKQRDVAIKVIDSIQVNRKYGITFVPREVNIVRKLTHKNINRIYHMIGTSTKICVAMELAANRSIADFMSKRGAFTEFMSWLLFISILKGLDHMHSKKIAHRNLKLENILLSENLIPKISDFHLALIVDQKNGQKLQTFYNLPYFAPEILQHLPYNPFISDIWSLGICLNIMVNDSLPFKIQNQRQMLEKQLLGDWKSTQTVEPNLSKQLKTFLSFMLEPDISLRPNTKQLSEHEWITNEPKSEEYSTDND